MPSSRKAWPARGKYAFGKKTFLMKAGMGVCPQWMWPWLFSELVATEAWAGSLKSVFLPVLSLPILETPSVQRHSKQAILQVDSCRGKRTSWSSWLCCETSSPSCFQMGVECPTSEASQQQVSEQGCWYNNIGTAKALFTIHITAFVHSRWNKIKALFTIHITAFVHSRWNKIKAVN